MATPLKNSSVLLGRRQGELKYDAARLVWLRPQLAPMSMDDGAANRQTHACSTRLRGVESIEDPIEMRRINTGPGIAHGHEDACLILLGADHKVPCPRLYRAHCFSSIQNEVQQDLLQLNAISLNGKQSIRKPGLDRNAAPEGHALCQYDHFVDCRVEIKTLLSRRRFLDLLPDAIDDVSGSICVANDTGECFPDLAHIRRSHLQKILGCPCIVTRAG